MWRGHVAGLIDLLGAGAELPPTSNPTGGAHVQIAVGIDTGKTRRQAAAHEVEGARWVGHLAESHRAITWAWVSRRKKTRSIPFIRSRGPGTVT